MISKNHLFLFCTIARLIAPLALLSPNYAVGARSRVAKVLDLKILRDNRLLSANMTVRATIAFTSGREKMWLVAVVKPNPFSDRCSGAQANQNQGQKGMAADLENATRSGMG